MKQSTNKLVLLSLFAAAALVLSYIESVLPPLYPAIPGIKMGIANIIVLVCLYIFTAKEALLLSLIRIFVSALLFGNAVSMIYSLAGAILSLAVMTILKKTKLFSVVGVSVAGAVCHNIGQVLVAIAILENAQIGYYMIVLSVTGVVAGILTGIAGAIVTKYFNKAIKIKGDK